ncbi:MAG TPA: hypothetical protein VD906_13900 [Caulobacteraceae bacterium]|nr:hypothetical protein [Caulobacteraceae bacterium]
MRRFALSAAAVLALAACGEEPPTGEDMKYAPVDGALPGPSANTILPPAGNTATVDPATNTPVTNTPATNSPPDISQPTGGPAADYRATLRLTGTEPFWGAQIGQQRIVLQRADHPSITIANTGPTINGDVAVWNAREFSIRLEPGNCSDGMSDNRYPYNATITVQGETLRGCAARLDRWPSGGG